MGEAYIYIYSVKLGKDQYYVSAKERELDVLEDIAIWYLRNNKVELKKKLRGVTNFKGIEELVNNYFREDGKNEDISKIRVNENCVFYPFNHPLNKILYYYTKDKK